VVLEAESSKIGNCRLPSEIWKAMAIAPRVAIVATSADRAAYLVRAYGDMVADTNRLCRVIDQLRPAHAEKTIADWQAMAGTGAFATLAQGLMEHHYDPRYDKHRARIAMPMIEVAGGTLTPETLPEAAARVAAAAVSLTG
jgi:tRNA 2-selenouridine synthase